MGRDWMLHAARARLGRLWRSSARVVLLLVALAIIVEGAYLAYAALLLPQRIAEDARRAGFELTFTALRSIYPGKITLQTPGLSEPGAKWSLRAEELELELAGYLPWGDPVVVEAATAEDLSFRDEPGLLGPIDVRIEALSMPLGAAAHRLSALGRSTRVRVGSLSARADLEISARIEGWSAEPASVVLGPGAVTLSRFELEAAAPNGGEPGERSIERATLEWADAGWSHERGLWLVGGASTQGNDAGIWFDVLGASSALRWMLSDLEGQPFELRAGVRLEGKSWILEKVQFQTDVTRAEGALYGSVEAPQGAILVRRGSASIGVAISPTGVTTRMTPDPHWLERQLQQLRAKPIRAAR